MEALCPAPIREVAPHIPKPTISNEARNWSSNINKPICFESYSAYIKYHMDHEGSGIDLDPLYKYVETSRNLQENHYDLCYLMEILRGEGPEVALGHRYQGGWSPEFSKLLCRPGDNAIVQIVLWLTPWGRHPDIRFLDSVGLLLHIHPRFFDDLFCDRDGFDDRLYKTRTTPFQKPDHVLLGDTVATIIHHPVGSGETAVVVIASAFDWPSHELRCVIDRDTIRQATSLAGQQGRAHGTTCFPMYPRDTNIWRQIYMECLRHLCGQRGFSCSRDNSLSSLALIPLLRLDHIRLQDKHQRTHAEFMKVFRDSSHEDYELLYFSQQRFRRQIEESEAQEEHLNAYISAQYHPGRWKGRAAYREIKEAHGRVVRQARRLDKEIQEFIQLFTGRLALLESSESIKMSSLQIQESKRG